jgi:transcriptional regulator with XRE-family HTH domain
MELLGQRIRELRMKRGFTQIELAKGLCTPSMISQIESDRARPSYKILVALAERLGVPLEHLLKEVNLDLEHTSKYKMAMGMVRAKEYQTAIPLLEELLLTEHHRIQKENLLLELALCHLEMGNAAEAEEKLNELYAWANSCQDEHLLATFLLYVGKVAIIKNEYSVAIFHTQRALDELQKAKEIDPELHAKVLLQLAGIHDKAGKTAEAVKYYESAMLLSQGSIEERGKACLRLAEAYVRQKNFEKAEEYASKACLLLDELANREERLEWQRRLIMLKREKVDGKTAVEELLQIAEAYERDADHTKAGEVYTDIAQIWLENHEFDKACAYAEKAKRRLPPAHPDMGRVNRVLAFVSFNRDYSEKGEKQLDNAIQIFMNHGKVAELEEVTLEMCRYLNEKGRHKEAFERMEQFHHCLMKKLDQRGIMI